jgi:lipopolysaccharide export system protein LptA
MTFLRSLLISLTLAFASSGTWAQTDNEPITIESDRMRYDNGKQTNVFSGNVVMVRGGFEIRAQRISIRQDKNGTQFAVATGSPAKFKRTNTRSAGRIEGSGKELRYNDKTEQLEILNGATLRRLQSGKVADEVRGAKIVYQANKDAFTVEGGKKSRVRVVIQPRGKKSKGKSSTLTPSTTLKK